MFYSLTQGATRARARAIQGGIYAGNNKKGRWKCCVLLGDFIFILFLLVTLYYTDEKKKRWKGQDTEWGNEFLFDGSLLLFGFLSSFLWMWPCRVCVCVCVVNFCVVLFCLCSFNARLLELVDLVLNQRKNWPDIKWTTEFCIEWFSLLLLLPCVCLCSPNMCFVGPFGHV